jgi:hypothetical protein
MTPGLLDLSIVTDLLLKQLEDAKQASRLWDEDSVNPLPATPTPPTFDIHFTGLPPDATRHLGGCQVSVYLFHVAPDKFYRNTFPGGGPARLTAHQPFALTLYYLLSAHSKSYVEEQQAMSLALKCFHESAISRAFVPQGNRVQEFTLTIEPETVDEIGRLWQSLSTPLRLSTVFRASVIFLEPQPSTLPDTKLVVAPNVTALACDDPPPREVTSATATSSGRVTITGLGFDTGSIEVQIGRYQFTQTATSPPPAGAFRISSSTAIDLQMPAGARAGRYLLSVRFDNRLPVARVRVEMP